MKARFATAEEIARWDECIQQNPGTGSFFQEVNFLQFKSMQKVSPWHIQYVVHTLGPSQCVYVGYLVKRIIGLGEYWYAPFGPQITQSKQLSEIIQQVQQLAPQAFTVLLEPTILVSSLEERERIIKNTTGAYAVTPIQPNVHTVIVAMQKNADELFAAFKQRTRRAIRQAQKAGVRVAEAPYSRETKDIFFTMYQETAKRAGFFIRSKQYYETFWDTYHSAGQGSFFFAYSNDAKEPIAGVFIVYDRQKALYKDGASVREGLPSGTLHLLQWEVIQWLAGRGVKTYDLHGVPPSWQQDDAQHRQHGLGIFKSSFGETTDQIGALQWDLKPRQALLWKKGVRKLYYTLAARRGGFFF